MNKIRFKNKLYRKLKRNPTNHFLRRRFNNYLCKLKHSIRLSRDNYYNSLIGDSNNPRKVWAVTNDILGRGKHNDIIAGTSFEIDDLRIDTNLDKANAFNLFFSSIGQRLGGDYKHYFNCKQSFVLGHISGMEILNVIKSLKNSGSVDVYGFNVKILKEISFLIVDVLEFLFNKCAFSGCFPKCLKNTIVVPIYKKGRRCDLSNYRPISLQPIFAKIFEKLLKVQIVKYMDKYGLLSVCQYGFRSGCSTEMAVRNLVALIHRSFECRRSVSSVFVDLSKAFDTINHSILLFRLFDCGFRGFMYDFLQSYLSDRVQRVKIKDVNSPTFVI